MPGAPGRGWLVGSEAAGRVDAAGLVEHAACGEERLPRGESERALAQPRGAEGERAAARGGRSGPGTAPPETARRPAGRACAGRWAGCSGGG
ncbi:MAG: hypothetical protein VX017_10505 [Pseudomonadota bacterium]|nr:hypothetical protein [Pseudomonadota bacterium]